MFFRKNGLVKNYNEERKENALFETKKKIGMRAVINPTRRKNSEQKVYMRKKLSLQSYPTGLVA